MEIQIMPNAITVVIWDRKAVNNVGKMRKDFNNPVRDVMWVENGMQ